MQSALELLDREGPNALTLRAIANSAGVTQSASAHHFADKEGLETAIAAVCFQQLSAMLAEASGAALPATDRLAAALRAYVQYAETNPSRFEFMFLSRLIGSPRGDDLRNSARTCFGILRLLIAEVVALAGGSAEDIETESVSAWALVHGLGKIRAEIGLPTQVRAVMNFAVARERVIASFIRGLTAKFEPSGAPLDA